MISFSEMTKPIIIVETDPKNEIDDEIFMHWAMKNLKGYSVYFMCVPGCKTREPEKAAMVAIERTEHVRTLFPTQFGKSSAYLTDESEFHLCTNNGVIEMLRRRNTETPLDVAYYIKIAPSWHINPWFYNQLNISTRIVMGELTNPDASINCTKAMHKTNDVLLREEYLQQEAMINAAHTISIPTHFARQIAFTYKIITSLPKELYVPIVDNWYAQFVGRPPAHLPWSCDISVANLMTIKNMFPQNDIKMIDIMEQDGRNMIDSERRTILSVKLNEFLSKAPAMENSVYQQYANRLFKIAMLVEEITKCYYIDSNFSSNSLNDNALARENWNAFIYKYKPDATPAYDLLAAVALKEPGSLADVDLCRDAISRISD